MGVPICSLSRFRVVATGEKEFSKSTSITLFARFLVSLVRYIQHILLNTDTYIFEGTSLSVVFI